MRVKRQKAHAAIAVARVTGGRRGIHGGAGLARSRSAGSTRPRGGKFFPPRMTHFSTLRRSSAGKNDCPSTLGPGEAGRAARVSSPETARVASKRRARCDDLGHASSCASASPAMAERASDGRRLGVGGILFSHPGRASTQPAFWRSPFLCRLASSSSVHLVSHMTRFMRLPLARKIGIDISPARPAHPLRVSPAPAPQTPTP